MRLILLLLLSVQWMFIYPEISYSYHGIPVQADSNADASLVNVNYQELREVIQSYEGQKTVLLNIWATWCGPCVEELPYLLRLQEEYPDRLKVILVSADMKSDRSRVVPFLKKQGVTWKTYFKRGNNQKFLNHLSDEWSGALPFTKIWSRQGEVVAEWEGAATFDKFKSNIKKAFEANHD